ncbi:Uncharacterised protein [Salmonella enterica subsp. arizonae]|uniref:Uncharacterized protein n=1 Tax=Salmonella enterica subsp. arizonae TaxID=59203 RepID=A0A379SRD3_SALER|nr:Uncharacterised protein [Salmonella enterica subsp. arizonae]
MAFQLAGTDMHGSPLLSLQSNTVTMFSWGPYGGCPPPYRRVPQSTRF